MNDGNLKIELDDGGRIDLISMLGKSKEVSKDEFHRNVFRFDAAGNVIWQVGTYNPFPNSTFTNIYFDKEKGLFGYNFDGVEYAIDLDSGVVGSKLLMK